MKKYTLIPVPEYIEDLTNKRFGNFIVAGFLRQNEKSTSWLCNCKCGNIRKLTDRELKTGRIKSCGCKRNYNTHGLANTYHANIWELIKRRCYDPKNKRYPLYGARGIKMCDRWLNGENGKHGLTCFYEDMGERPTPKHSVDRIDNNGGYSPENCRWASQKQQNNNTRYTYTVLYKGKTYTSFRQFLEVVNINVRDIEHFEYRKHMSKQEALDYLGIDARVIQPEISKRHN